MRLACTLLGLSLAALSAPSPTWAAPMSLEERAVVVGEEAVLLPPPEVVAPGVVQRAAWSVSGKYLLLVRQTLRLPSGPDDLPDTSLVLWNAESRQSREVWKSRDLNAPHDIGHWLPATEVAFGFINRTVPGPPAEPGGPPTLQKQRWLLRLDARRGVARPVARVGDRARLEASSSRPLGALFDPERNVIQVVRADGSFKPLPRLPEGTQAELARWTADGSALLITAVHPGPMKESLTAKRYRLDPQAGTVTPEPEQKPAPPPSPAAEERGPLRLVFAPATVSRGETKTQVRTLWLEAKAPSEAPRAMVSPDAEAAVFSPRGDSLCFVSQGAAFVQPLVTIPKASYVAMRDAARRKVLMSNARQLGLALAIYAQENEEILPGADEPVGQLISRHLPNERLLEGFVYAFPGGRIGDVREPAGTLLGYIPGPSGRVNLFVDGHAEWEGDGAQGR